MKDNNVHSFYINNVIYYKFITFCKKKGYHTGFIVTELIKGYLINQGEKI
jgi:hypothetical protein